MARSAQASTAPTTGADEAKGGAEVETVVRTLSPKDCPIVSVSVYTEQVAEVMRLIHLEPGLAVGSVVDLVIKGFTHKLDKDSVRVSGTGPAKILNVSSEAVYYSPQHFTEEDDSVVEGLKKELKKATQQRDETHQEISRLCRRQNLLEQYSSAATGPTGAKDMKEIMSLENFKGLLDFYASNSQDSDMRQNELRREVVELDAKVLALEREIFAKGREATTATETKTITVAVEVTGEGAIDLDLRYIVSGAQWRASYDVRISSADQSLVLYYYGLVSQASGEDWCNVHLALSTATPSKGGLPPVLPTTIAQVYQPPVAFGMSKKSKSRMEGGGGAKMAARGMMMPQAPMGAMSAAFCADMECEEMAAEVATTSVEGGGADNLGPSTFNIHKSSTVKSDNKPQKVVIGVVTLPSTFRHYVVPAKEASAYIQSKTVNASEYTLMPSSDVSIFFDNNYVARTELKLVQPGEDFQAFLGVDPSVRIDYVGPKTVAGSVGLFSSKKTQSHETSVVVTNQKAIPISVALVQSLPLSNTDKIKVTLLTPTPESLTSVNCAEDIHVGASGESSGEATYLNKDTSNVVWVRDLKPKAKTTIAFKYSLEWPAGTEISVKA